MNLINGLNFWGERFMSYAMPLLWQSSLLILLLLAFDVAFQKKLSSGVRYIFWLIIIVKLVLPPSLAFPTSPAWWLRSSKPPQTDHQIIIRFSDSPFARPPRMSERMATLAVPPSLTPAAWALIGAALGASSLMGFLILRTRRVRAQFSRMRHCDGPKDDQFHYATRVLSAIASEIGLHGPFRLQITETSMSPAVVGLLHPSIVLPRELLRELSAPQLRAVLLHELMHLRRYDLLVNSVQTILQVLFWWNPLLWLANARIRALREEAVDESVMIVLGEDRGNYPSTLLQVARLITQPPPLLAFVGILETRRAMQRRFKRLVSFQPARRTSIAFTMVLLAAFVATALPLGAPRRAPEKDATNASRALSERSAAPTEVLGDDVTARFNGRLSNNLAFIRKKLTSDNGQPVSRVVYLRDTNQFFTNLKRWGNLSQNASQAEVLAVFDNLIADVGIKIQSPKKIFVSDKGKLFLHTTLSDADAIEHLLGILMSDQEAVDRATKQQVYIRARFVEVPRGTYEKLTITHSHNVELPDHLKSQLGFRYPENTPRDWGAVLCTSEYESTIAELKRGGAELKDLNVTTLSGRQCELAQLETMQIVTLNTQALVYPGESSALKTQSFMPGVVINLNPYVAPEDDSIHVGIAATVNQFLGYDNPKGKIRVYIDGKSVKLTPPLPHFRNVTASATVILRDGDTALLGATNCFGIKYDQSGNGTTNAEPTQKALLVFVTPTLVSADGRPVKKSMIKQEPTSQQSLKAPAVDRIPLEGSSAG